jgi:hypothetical protein
VCVCVCICVCEGERETRCVCVCVCVCFAVGFWVCERVFVCVPESVCVYVLHESSWESLAVQASSVRCTIDCREIHS